MIKLHLCCGKRDFGEEWTHIDVADFPHVKYHSIFNLSQFEDNSVDVMYCSHGIAYMDREKFMYVLKEWRRVLKPGGVLRLATPDFKTMADLYIMGKINLGQILGPLYGKMHVSYKTQEEVFDIEEGGEILKMVEHNETIYHRTTYDFRSLADLLLAAGFCRIRYYDHKATEHSHIDDHSAAYLNGVLISLNVECNK